MAENAESRELAIKDGAEKTDSSATDIEESLRGWLCCLGVFLINMHTWGLNAAYSVFLSAYLAQDRFADGGAVTYAFIGGLSISIGFLLSPLISRYSVKFGCRAMVVTGLVFETTSFIAASFASAAWQLLLSQGICFGIGMGLVYLATVGILPQWFSKNSGAANAIASGGSGIGGLTYALASSRLIQEVGIPWTLRILGIIAFCTIGVAAFLVKDRNKENKVSGSLELSLLKNMKLLWILGYSVFSILAYIVCLFSLPTYARSIGLSAEQGSLAAALLSLGQGIGRPAIGYLSDRYGRIQVTSVSCVVAGILTLALWTQAKWNSALLAYGFLVGLVAGAFWAVIAPLVADVTGLQHLPSGLSWVWLTIVVPATFSQPIALWIVDYNGGSYLGAQIFVGVMYLAAASMLLGLWLQR